MRYNYYKQYKKRLSASYINVSFCSAIAIIENTYNKILLTLFLYFGLLIAFYEFLLISVSISIISIMILHFNVNSFVLAMHIHIKSYIIYIRYSLILILND